MKYLLTLLTILPIYLFAQNKPTKGDTKIIVSVKDTSGLYDRIRLSFFENGYTIESEDRQMKFLASTEKGIPKKAISIKIRVLIKDSTIVFSGAFASSIEFGIGSIKEERHFEGISYGGMKNSDIRNSWDELEKFASRFGSSLTFSK